ncbi:DinB family protein [Paenibacillus sp. CF384]|uniref:DinB family protein n=1 Tax=Paenibacillus sp. CF384 TaxID=1884382 RepID=UPI00089CBE99|nr:DinB family protein [Paenibacillus sp. CF384]SDW28054.1 DinB superfamily protein [Paenibacillus sp. CF384]
MNTFTGLLSTFQSLIPFAASLRSLSDEMWSAPLKTDKWSTRSVIGHIMLWDRHFLQEAIMPIVEGRPLTLRHSDYDTFNRHAAAYADSISKEQLLSECMSVREELWRLLTALSEEKREWNYTDGDGNPFTIHHYLDDFVAHDRHHLDEIDRFIGA